MKAFTPKIAALPDRKMLSITTVGDPGKVMEKHMKALYGTAYGTKMKVFKPQGKVMSLGKLCAMWPDAHLKPKDQWTGIWGIPVPDFVKKEDLLQKDPEIPVNLEIWPGGTYAEILHLGPYSEEGPTVEKIHQFITDSGYQISGSHEEEYLTKPDVKDQKTIIRYRIEKSKN